MIKTINIIVLYNGSILSKIYLSLLLKNNYKPKKILVINYAPSGRKYHLISKYFGKFSAKLLLNIYLKFKNKLSIRNKHISEKLLNIFKLSHEDLCDKKFLISDYYDEIELTNVDDPLLSEYLKKQSIKTVLYTGGWILKKNILENSSCKFIHIHPGILPEVKGADCFLWSYLLEGRLGYSCLYMNEEIDAGEILHKKNYEFQVEANIFKNIDNEIIYKLIIQYYDPCLRILTFIDFLNNKNTNALENLNVSDNNVDILQFLNPLIQNHEHGRTYYFMHPKLRRKVIKSMLVRSTSGW
jgi:hypothetical protein